MAKTRARAKTTSKTKAKARATSKAKSWRSMKGGVSAPPVRLLEDGSSARSSRSHRSISINMDKIRNLLNKNQSKLQEVIDTFDYNLCIHGEFPRVDRDHRQILIILSDARRRYDETQSIFMIKIAQNGNKLSMDVRPNSIATLLDQDNGIFRDYKKTSIRTRTALLQALDELGISACA